MPIHRSLATDPGLASLRCLADQIETLRHEDRRPAILRACLELGGTVSRRGRRITTTTGCAPPAGRS